MTIRVLRTGLLRPGRQTHDPSLATTVWGLNFANPIGLAAGFDKDAQVMDACLRLGFGFVEVGTITPRPQPGNPRPRLFRLTEEQAIVNRLGFNSGGHAGAIDRLRERRRQSATGPVGVNLGANRDSAEPAQDYAAGAQAFAALADYLVVNLSSPNTPGLRALQEPARLRDIVRAVKAARDAAGSAGRPPLLVKIAPDLSESDAAAIATTVAEERVEGLIVGNTTIARPPGLRGRAAQESGGLSGRPLLAPSTALLARIYRLSGGDLPLIGVGGVASGADAYAKIRAGASLVQLYTALVYQGPGLIGRIKRELAGLLRADGFVRVADATGADHR